MRDRLHDREGRTAIAPRVYPREAARASPLIYGVPFTPHALLATRQDAISLSDENKLLIRCAWADTLAFRYYYSLWAIILSAGPCAGGLR